MLADSETTIFETSGQIAESTRPICRYRTITLVDWPETGLGEINRDLPEADAL